MDVRETEKQKRRILSYMLPFWVQYWHSTPETDQVKGNKVILEFGGLKYLPGGQIDLF